MTAARAGNVDAVRLLLDRGADVNAREKYKGQTALMWAAAERHPAVVKLLLDRGADWKVRSFDRETKMPRLSAASPITPHSARRIPRLLVCRARGRHRVRARDARHHGGVDINYGDVDNTTALVVAIMNKQYTFAKFLIERGADVNIAGGYGRTALYAIVDIRNEDYSALPARKTEDPLPTLDLVKALLDRRANLDATLTAKLPGSSGMDFGDTTLGEGHDPAHARGARRRHGGDPSTARRGRRCRSCTTKDGNTALMFAAGVGYRDKNTRGSRTRRARGSEDLRRGRLRRPPGEQPRRDRAARRRGPRRRHHRAVSRRSRRRAEREDQAGLHAARRRDGQIQPDCSCRCRNRRPSRCCKSSERSKGKT